VIVEDFRPDVKAKLGGAQSGDDTLSGLRRDWKPAHLGGHQRLAAKYSFNWDTAEVENARFAEAILEKLDVSRFTRRENSATPISRISGFADLSNFKYGCWLLRPFLFRTALETEKI
jgi:hypothetical protein